jgi:hypothetical protein
MTQSSKGQSLREILQDLDTETEKPRKGTIEPGSNHRGEISRWYSERALSTFRRHKLLRKLGLRWVLGNWLRF